MSYIRKHWRGELSLGVSFWVNLVLLNVGIKLLVLLFPYSRIIENPVSTARLVIIFGAFAFLIVCPWQIIGLWRSCNNHIEKSGRRFWARSAQVFVVLGFVLTLGKLNASWPIYKELFCVGFGKDDEFGNYTVTLEKNNTLVHLQGGLGFGVSEDIAKLLKKYPEVEGIILDSYGGRIYEGRELAKLISNYGLDTYSLEGCYSAATTAFIAGKNRLLGMGANLAFHQYRRGYKNLGVLVDMEVEQAKDLVIFQKQGINSEFLDKLFNTPHDDLWYPTVDEMLGAGVIHGILNPSDLLPVEYPAITSKEVDKVLSEIPLYRTIEKYDPDTYRKIQAEFEAEINKGASYVELKEAGDHAIARLAFAAMQESSDEAIIQVIHAIVNALKTLKDKDPVLCMKFLYPEQYGRISFPDYLSEDIQTAMLDAMNKVIIDAYEKNNPAVDTEAAELLMEELGLELGEYADYMELEGLQNTDDYRRHCDAVIKIYQLILNEDESTAANTLRYMFSRD